MNSQHLKYGVLIMFLIFLSHDLKLHTLKLFLYTASLEIEVHENRYVTPPAIARCPPSFSAGETTARFESSPAQGGRLDSSAAALKNNIFGEDV